MLGWHTDATVLLLKIHRLGWGWCRVVHTPPNILLFSTAELAKGINFSLKGAQCVLTIYFHGEYAVNMFVAATVGRHR